MIGGRVLDPPAILDFATGRTAYGRAVLDVAVRLGIVVAVPAAALAEAWAAAPAADWPLLELLRDLPVVVLEPLDGRSAEQVGILAGERGRPADGTAHAVVVARQRGWPVITGDRESVIALDPRVGFESLP